MYREVRLLDTSRYFQIGRGFQGDRERLRGDRRKIARDVQKIREDMGAARQALLEEYEEYLG